MMHSPLYARQMRGLIRRRRGMFIMLFGEKLRQLRLANGYTQEKAARELGVTVRAYQNYEACRVYPKNTAIFGKAAVMFDVTADYLLSDEDRYIIDASERGGPKARKDVAELVTELGGFFAGGEFTEEDKDKVMKTINDLYWNAKESNKRYTPERFRLASRE
jgi:transcriptional regulator with XRE-family HTH domain